MSEPEAVVRGEPETMQGAAQTLHAAILRLIVLTGVLRLLGRLVDALAGAQRRKRD